MSIPSLFDVKGKVGQCYILPSASITNTDVLLGCVAAAVVTGGGSGIGAMFAAAYVQNGATVYIASRKEKQLREVRYHRPYPRNSFLRPA